MNKLRRRVNWQRASLVLILSVVVCVTTYAQLSCELGHISQDAPKHQHKHSHEHAKASHSDSTDSRHKHDSTSCCGSIDELFFVDANASLIPSLVFTTHQLVVPAYRIEIHIGERKTKSQRVLATSPPRSYFPTSTVVLII